MRPLEHSYGAEKNRGAGKVHTTFGTYFVKAFGRYCMVCEARLTTDMQIDHRLGQAQAPGQLMKFELLEAAFMGICPACNRHKSRKLGDNVDAPPGDFFWPDVDNTFLLFNYERDGKLTPNEELITKHCDLLRGDESKQANATRAIARAKNTIDLYVLNGGDSSPVRGQSSQQLDSLFDEAADLRVADRCDAYEVAQQWLASYASVAKADDRSVLRRLLATQVIATGHWSIWMQRVLAQPREVQAELLPMLLGVLPGQSNCIAWSNGSLTFTAHPPLPAQTVNREIKTQDYLLRLRDGWETGKRKIYETRAAKRAAFEEHQKLEREMRHLEGDPRKESSYRQRDESDDESSEDAQAYRDDMEEDFEIQHSPVLTTGMQAQGTRALRPRQAVLSKAPLIRKRKLDSELESQFDPSDRNRKQSRPNSD